MSEPPKLGLVGATGLIGRSLMREMIGRSDFRLVALARREVQLPRGVRMEMRLAPVYKWDEVLDEIRPDCLVCALGTTWNKSGRDEAIFRAVDYELVLKIAQAAKAAGTGHFIVMSSVGAALSSKNRYLRVKAEMERDLARLGFRRLDILQPGLLRGAREDDPRRLERVGMILSPLFNLFLQGQWRRYRAIDARQIARAILALAKEKPGGRFVHDYDALVRAARKLQD